MARASQAARLFRYGRRFLSDKRYRNEILDLVGRYAQGSAHADVAATQTEVDRAAFLRGRRMFVAGGCELTFLVEHLETLGVTTCHTFAAGRASDPMTELMTPGSRALTEPWDYYLLSISQLLRHVIHRVQTRGIDYTREEQESDLAGLIDNYRHAIVAIREKSAAPIFLFSYLLTYHPTYGLHEFRSIHGGWSLVELWHVYHLKLYELAREFPSVYLLDADLALDGIGKTAAIDPEHSTGIYDHPTRDGARELGAHLVRHLAVLEPKRRKIKCAVFDLDGTLWAGVLREDGPDAVAVREYYLDVIEMLAARGILLAVCSKNDPAEIEHLPKLLGDVVYPKIVSAKLSWQPKSEVLKEIAQELNIGIDSLAFFDDSEFERAEVAANAPEVLVLTPEQIFESPNLPEFQQSGEITHETITRTAKYHQQAQRKEAERSSTGLRDFLEGCKLELDLRAPEPGELSRVYELLQRTNQLNATLTRTSLDQLKTYVSDPSRYVVRIVRLKDRFGDYGLIGFAACEKGPQSWRVLDLAFSCRSMGRGVEQAILNHLGALARSEGAQSLSIDFVVGPRNERMLEILKECDFDASDDATSTEGATLHLARGLRESASLGFPNWLNVQVRAAS